MSTSNFEAARTPNPTATNMQAAMAFSPTRTSRKTVHCWDGTSRDLHTTSASGKCGVFMLLSQHGYEPFDNEGNCTSKDLAIQLQMLSAVFASTRAKYLSSVCPGRSRGRMPFNPGTELYWRHMGQTPLLVSLQGRLQHRQVPCQSCDTEKHSCGARAQQDWSTMHWQRLFESDARMAMWFIARLIKGNPQTELLNPKP